MINLPIFRAKKVDSGEYVEGYLLPKFENNYYISLEWSMDFDGYTPDFEKIDISTLSIHFPDMLDSTGNKIFASLQEDGKGGDLIDNFNFTEKYRIQIAIYTDNCFYIVDVDLDRYNLKEYINKGGIRVMGIQE